MNDKSYRDVKKTIFSLIVALCGVFWIYSSRVPDSLLNRANIQAPQVGFKAPPFSLPTMDGEVLSLDNLSGRPLVINFWASWCPPCKAEMPAFQLASEEYSGSDLLITTINATNLDTVENARNFLQREEISLLVLLDSMGSASKTYNIHSLPTTFFINREGTISTILVGGPVPLALLRTEIDKILQE